MSLADFDSYRQAQNTVGQSYLDQRHWNQMSLRNIAESGIFSADRSVRDYYRKYLVQEIIFVRCKTNRQGNFPLPVLCCLKTE